MEWQQKIWLLKPNKTNEFYVEPRGTHSVIPMKWNGDNKFTLVISGVKIPMFFAHDKYGNEYWEVWYRDKLYHFKRYPKGGWLFIHNKDTRGNAEMVAMLEAIKTA